MLPPSQLHVDTVAPHRHPFLEQQLALPLPLGKAAVRPDNAVPGKVLVRGRKDAADEARRFGIDAAVSLDRASRNPSNPPHARAHSRSAVPTFRLRQGATTIPLP